jgi:hypothetical protein
MIGNASKKLGAYKMKIIHKLLITISILLIAFAMGRRVIRSFYASRIHNPLLQKILGINISEPIEYPFGIIQEGYVKYNYDRLVHLINESIEVKRIFYESFYEPIKHRKEIDITSLKELLSELYREKVRLESYILYEKTKEQEQLSDKKERSLLYFLKVLKKNIQDLEAILKKV